MQRTAAKWTEELESTRDYVLQDAMRSQLHRLVDEATDTTTARARQDT
jgi:hypothetical protein